MEPSQQALVNNRQCPVDCPLHFDVGAGHRGGRPLRLGLLLFSACALPLAIRSAIVASWDLPSLCGVVLTGLGGAVALGLLLGRRRIILETHQLIVRQWLQSSAVNYVQIRSLQVEHGHVDGRDCVSVVCRVGEERMLLVAKASPALVEPLVSSIRLRVEHYEKSLRQDGALCGQQP